jgi:hypothetical protein
MEWESIDVLTTRFDIIIPIITSIAVQAESLHYVKRVPENVFSL